MAVGEESYFPILGWWVEGVTVMGFFFLFFFWLRLSLPRLTRYYYS